MTVSPARGPVPYELRADSGLYEAGEDGIRAATFSGDRLICATDARLAVFALPTGEPIHVHEVGVRPGTQLMAWGLDHVVAFDGRPRLIEVATGAVVHIWEDLNGGAGLHQPDANMKPPEPPWIARDPGKPRFALGVVGLGLGAVFGVMAINDNNGTQCNAQNQCKAGPLSDARRAALGADIGFIAGGVLLAGGAGLLLWAPSGAAKDRQSARLPLAPAIGPTGGGLSLGGAW